MVTAFMSSHDSILVIYCGSSSVKFALFSGDVALERRLYGEVDGVGSPSGRMRMTASGDQSPIDTALVACDHKAALSIILESFKSRLAKAALNAKPSDQPTDLKLH